MHNKTEKQKILIVDDIEENIKLLGSFLKDKYKIAVAVNGKNAVDLAKSFKPDLTLMDINMPVMDGYTAAKLIFDDPEIPKHPLIFTTALVELKNVLEGLDLGAVDYITKPFELKILERRISLHLSLKKSQEIIEKQNLELKEHIETKNKFFSIVSHDLKSPFGGLLNLSEMMLDNYEMFSKEEIRENLVGLLKSIRQLYDFVEKLLDWSRIQTRKLKPKLKNLLLNEFINETILLLRNSAEAKNIEIEFLDDKKYFALADSNIFDTILRNLLSNAIKFSYEGGKIKISVEELDEYCKITIADNGTGIPKDALANLFKLDSHKLELGTNNEKGTGLGLIITKEMVEIQGGSISVISEVDEGTKFFFTIPTK